MPGEFDRYNMKRSVSLTANIAGEDLGRVAGQHRRGPSQRAGAPPKGVDRRRPRPDRRRCSEMLDGLAHRPGAGRRRHLPAADGQLPVAAAGAGRRSRPCRRSSPAWSLALWLTGTTLNIQSFMGAIMAIGVAVANAILLVTFAERHRREGEPAARRRPSTGAARPAPADPDDQLRHDRRHGADGAGLGEGGEQTAPLGRAVIGGLAAATLATLLVLPSVFALVQGRAGRRVGVARPRRSREPALHHEEDDGVPRAGAALGQRRAARSRRPTEPIAVDTRRPVMIASLTVPQILAPRPEGATMPPILSAADRPCGRRWPR